MTTPELPPLTASELWVHEDPMTGEMRESAASYTKYSVEARESILVAEIERLRALWMAAEERAAHAEEAALSHAEKIERLRASLQIEKDAAALSYKNGMALGEQLHDCQCTVRELRAEVEAMRRELKKEKRKNTIFEKTMEDWEQRLGEHPYLNAIDAAREAKP